MRPQTSVQMAHSAQYAVAKFLPTADKASRLRGWRYVVAWEIDQLSVSCRNFLDLLGIYPIGLWREPEALDLIEDDVWARQSKAHAALPSLCKPLREGTA